MSFVEADFRRQGTECNLARKWYFGRFGVNEDPQTTSSEPTVANEVRDGQVVVKFIKGIDFQNGGSIPF